MLLSVNRRTLDSILRHPQWSATLVGSNITNPLVASGLGALVSTYAVPRPLVLWDLPWETVTGLILWAILWLSKGKLGKWAGFYLIGLYIVYIVLRAVFFSVGGRTGGVMYPYSAHRRQFNTSANSQFEGCASCCFVHDVLNNVLIMP